MKKRIWEILDLKNVLKKQICIQINYMMLRLQATNISQSCGLVLNIDFFKVFVEVKQ